LIHREFSTLAISVLAVFIALTFISCTATPPGGGKDTLTSRAEEYASVYNSATWNHDPDKWTELFDFFAPEIQATCKGGEEGFGIATANAAAFGLGFLQLKANQVELRISKVKASGTEGTVKMSLHKQEALGGTQITDEDPLEWKLVDEKWWVNTELLNMYGELPPYCTAAPVAAVPSSVETDIGTKKTSETPTTESEIGNDLDKLIETKKCLGCDLSGTNLAGANLTGALMQSASLAGADLTYADLGGADLYAANLYDANLRMANLTGANLTEANLTEADLSDANLTDANLFGADLDEANLTGANLTGANLANAWLNEADLSGSDLSDANLTDANLFGADLDGVIGADFTGALNVPAKYLKD
jgi:hypothetical protein